jgi:hypothetical protein
MITQRTEQRGFALLLVLVMSTLLATESSRTAGRLVALVRFKEYLATREDDLARVPTQDEAEVSRLTALSYGLALLETGEPTATNTRESDGTYYCKVQVQVRTSSMTVFTVSFKDKGGGVWELKVAPPNPATDPPDLPYPESFTP